MVMGHLATALIPASKLKSPPLWWLLFCAQFGDIFWLTISLFGLETLKPDSFLDVSIIGMSIDMPYSHTGAGVLIESLVIGGIAFAVWKSVPLAAWSAFLTFAHWLQDLASGWQHEVFTVGSPKIGLGLYNTNPYLAMGIEVGFALAMVLLYFRMEASKGREVSRRGKIILLAVFVGGSTFFIPNATHSMRQIFGL